LYFVLILILNNFEKDAINMQLHLYYFMNYYDNNYNLMAYNVTKKG
jgi:hypothetical protein